MAGHVEERLKFLDLVFVVDTTGSMSPFIEEVKNKITDIIDGIESSNIGPRVNFGLVAYGDHPPEDSILTKSFELTENRTKIKNFVRSIPRTAGGDYPEAVADGLHAGLTMNWHHGSNKVVVLMGDAPPHGYTDDSGDEFPQGCPCGLDPLKEAERAKEEGITIHAVGVNPQSDVERSFQSLATTTGGSYVALSDSGKLVDLILGLMQREAAKMETDIKAYNAVATSRNYDPQYLSTVLHIEREVAEQTIIRLQKRGLLAGGSGVAISEKVEKEGQPTGPGERFCRHCGSRVGTSAMFCRTCGRRLV